MERPTCHHARRQEPPPRQTALAADGVVEHCSEQAHQRLQPPGLSTLFDLTAVAEASAAAEMLSKGRTAATVYELAAHALGLAQHAIEQMVARTPPESRPACSAGCAFCCAIPVAVSPPEALYIAEWWQRTLDAEAQADLQTRLRTRVEARQGWMVDARGARKRLCLFLRDDGRCGIYPLRPLACRGYSSLSRAACEEAFTDQGDRVRVHTGVRELAAGVIYGLILASKALELEWGRYELEAAVLRALEIPDAAARWAGGERVFAGCDQVAMPAPDAQRLMAWNRVSGSPGATP